MKRRPRDLPVIGWREWVRLPGLHDVHIKAKVDTGARTSSLHAFDLQSVVRRGQKWVEFEIHPMQRSAQGAVRVSLPVHDERRVRSSDGRSQLRPVVLAHVDVSGEPWPIEITLTRRDAMGFRMLLGREALRGRVLIDTSRSFVTSRPPGLIRRKRRKK